MEEVTFLTKLKSFRPLLTFLAGLSGTFFGTYLGGYDTILETLIIFMALDIFLGVGVALLKKGSDKTETGKLSAKVMLSGVFKKVVTLSLIMVAHRIDMSTGNDYVRSFTVFALIGQEGLSILENAVLLGVKVPTVVQDGLDILDKSNDEGKGL